MTTHIPSDNRLEHLEDGKAVIRRLDGDSQEDLAIFRAADIDHVDVRVHLKGSIQGVTLPIKVEDFLALVGMSGG